ncbi:MAG: helix-turn-helix domain-containing protein [Prolixibacteraceae bacterium]|nr:helix-turn-helix domain-containing protein [Prolixibacteraceae bacterium]
MEEIVKGILALSGELKEVKAQLQYLRKTRAEIFNETWIDGQDVLLALNISQRTLQTLRDSGTLPFSRLNGKFYYMVSDLEALLESNYSRNLKNLSHD